MQRSSQEFRKALLVRNGRIGKVKTVIVGGRSEQRWIAGGNDEPGLDWDTGSVRHRCGLTTPCSARAAFMIISRTGAVTANTPAAR